jgi:hypothetical protein
VTQRGPRNRERSFGVSVGGVLCVLAAALVWRGHVPRAEWTGAIGIVLLTLGLVYAPALKPLSDVWWKAAAALGWFNARVLLTLAFAIILTPIGLVWRLIGRDPLVRRRGHSAGWADSPARYRDRRHVERMF